ncbi:MAG: gamma-glutamyltransferase family protein [Longimicrobiales bacterium]
MVIAAVRRTAWLFVLGACATPAAQHQAVSTPPPEIGRVAAGVNGAVSSANPLASEAGIEVLRAGGNAVDAAVATAFAIGVAEPQMSGIGGSGSMLIWHDDAQRAEYLDFYAMQPVTRFRGHTGYDGGADLRIVGVPGNVAGLLAAHERFGRLSREQVIAPAIRMAEHGVPVGQILAGFIRSDSAKLARFPEGYRRMYPDGSPLRVGAILRNPELADALRHIARDGAAAFYNGTLTQEIVRVMNAGGHPVTAQDFAEYEPLWKRPLCIDYRGMQVLSAPPPQTGAQVLHTLQMLESHDLPSAGLPTRSARAFDILTSALRVGMADNRGANDDPRWRTVHANGRITPAFAARRATLVGTGTAPDTIAPVRAADSNDATPEPGCVRFEPYGAATASADAQSMRSAGGRQHGEDVAAAASSHEARQESALGSSGAFSPGIAFTRDVAFTDVAFSPDVAFTRDIAFTDAAFTRDIAFTRDVAFPPDIVFTRDAAFTPGVTLTPDVAIDSGVDASAEHQRASGETTHLSVVDGEGNAVALTQTNSTVFGSGAWVHGFFLNDSGYIFRSEEALEDVPARWRTRTTTISPTIVMDGNDVELVIGAPGGGRIPTEIVQTMVYLLDYDMSPLDAVRMPRIYPSSQSPRVQLEHGFAASVLHEAREMGYDPVPPAPGYARLYFVKRENGTWVAVADPRHDGEARAY